MPIAQKILLECLRLATAPITRLCVKHSIRAQDLIEVVKINYIRCAEAELQKLGQSITVSRLSAISGLNRREVMRVRQAPDLPDEGKGVIPRILGQWSGDKRFLDKRKKPRALKYKDVDSEFRKLVKLISQDLNPMTVLLELERIGVVEKSEDTVRLARPAYIPSGDTKTIFSMLGRDVSDLIDGASENALQNPTPPNLHAKTHYDRIVRDALPDIRAWFLHEGAALHQRARAFLGQYDTDLNPALLKRSDTVRVAIGTFSVVHSNEATDTPSEKDQNETQT